MNERTNHAVIDLLSEYVRCGLVQFGHFEKDTGVFWPVSFHFEMMPSFPKLLTETAHLLAPYFEITSERDRLLTMPDTIALGAVISTQSGMPMLYPRRDELRDFTAAFAIEGTADVGNPVTLLTDVLLNGKKELEIIALSERVGLPVDRIVTLFDAEVSRDMALNKSKMRIEAGFTANEIVQNLSDQHEITPTLTQTIREWTLTL